MSSYDLGFIVSKIIDGSITDDELSNLIEEQMLLKQYEGKLIIDYILDYKRNTDDFDQEAIYDTEIARKYLERNLRLEIKSEVILMSKYNDEKTIFEVCLERNLGKIFNKKTVDSILNAVSKIIANGNDLNKILSLKLKIQKETKYFYEVLKECDMDLWIIKFLVANDEKKAINLIKKGHDELLECVCNTKVLSSMITDDECVFDRVMKKYIGDDFLIDELKKYIISDLSIDIESLSADSELFEKLQETNFLDLIYTTTSLFASLKLNDIEDLDYIWTVIPQYGLSPLDFILKSNVVNKEFESLARVTHEVTEIYLKYKRWDVLKKVPFPEVLATKVDDKNCILDYFYTEFIGNENFSSKERLEVVNQIIEYVSKDKKFAKFVFESENVFYGYLCLRNEDFLFDNDLDLGNDINLDVIIKNMLNNGKISELCSIKPTGGLLTYKSKYLNNKMIIEYIVDNYEDASVFSEIPIETWLYNTDVGMPLLQFLINKNRDFIISLKDKSPTLISNKNTILILIANGISVDMNSLEINLNENDKLALEDYCKKLHYDQRYNKEISVEATEAIEKLREVLMEDGKSDIEVIDLACNAFREQFANNYPFAMRDLNCFINVKMQHPEFSLKKVNETSYFSDETNVLGVSNIRDIDTFNHEFGHALHWYSSNYSLPDNIKNLLVLNDFLVDKILQYAKEIYDNKNTFAYIHSVEYDRSFLDDFQTSNYLDEIRGAFLEAINDYDYSNEYVEFLSENITPAEVFDSYYNKMLKIEHIVVLTSLEFGLENKLLDLFDALSMGKFYDGKLKKNESDKNYFSVGHGSEYYSYRATIFPTLHFNEIFAEYVSIIKSPRADEFVGILTNIMGNEFVDALREFYDSLYIQDVYELNNGGKRCGL